MKRHLLILAAAALLVLSATSCRTGNKEKRDDDIITLNSDNFDHEISKGLVMVDFWASWCMPCRAMSPVVDEIAGQMKGKVKVGKVDVDANGVIANRYKVQGIPNIIIFKDGLQVENLVGVQSKETLVQALEKHVSLHD